jgi:hypothetical protein
VDLWWSGKHDNHGGNIQVITAPDGWPLWTSDVRPGREHDTTALRTHAEILPVLRTWTDEDLAVLGDLGYEVKPTPSPSRSRNPKAANSPTSRRRTTRPTTANGPSVNAGTHYSRPHSRLSATSACVPGRSARS